MSKTIPLTQGYVTVVDDQDYEALSLRSWRVVVKGGGTIYAVRNADASERAAGSPKNICMHREILGIVYDGSKRVDHRNRDALDNRSDNLRQCSGSQNAANVDKRRGDSAYTSRYKGVSYDRRTGRWAARIAPHRGRVWLGRFGTEEEAARAYDRAAREIWGEFACLNFPDDH